MKRKILLIGWDAADWKVINKLLDAGKMPALETIVNSGVIGNLATISPPLSPMVWTSIATGMRADKHGILGFTEPDPDNKRIRPVSSRSRKVKAIWNILTQKNFKTNVVGWWPSHPAEPINGICVSNFYHRAIDELDKPWTLPSGAIFPSELRKQLAELRVHPQELTEAHILPFVPKAAKVDQDKDKRLASIGKIIAECSTVHSAATWIMENSDWDFMAVYYDAIDHFCHGFMNFYPPKLPNVPDDLYEIYNEVVDGGYRFHDMMLGRLLTLAGDDTTVILVSDHGFHSDHLRPLGIPNEPAGPAVQHRNLGIFAIKGEGIKKDERVYGATLLDITPTILTLFDLPVGRDMDGHTLVQIFEKPKIPDFIESWELVEGNAGMLDEKFRQDPFAEHAIMEQMIALGYVEPPDENIEKQIEKTIQEANYNLARVFIDAGKYIKAVEILEKLHQNEPKARRFAFQLAKCYQIIGKIKECRIIVEKIIKNESEKSKNYLEYIKNKKEKNDIHENLDKLSDNDKLKFEQENRERKDFVSNAQLNLLQGSLCMAENNYENALIFLLEAEKANPRMPTLHQQIGKTYLQMNHLDDAERAFNKALEIDSENATAHHGLAMVFMRKKLFQNAAEEALRSIGIIFHNAYAHFLLGKALIRLGKTERAIEAFKVATTIRPGLIRAHRWLALIYGRTGKIQESNTHLEIIRELIKKRKENLALNTKT